VHDAAPDFKVHLVRDFDGVVVEVLGDEPDVALYDVQALDAELVSYARVTKDAIMLIEEQVRHLAGLHTLHGV
jgi:hypothetical protein